MKAAVVQAAGQPPVYGDFAEPVAQAGHEVIEVSASALSPFSKARSSGSHYSSQAVFPAVAGADGVGRTADGRRVYFALPEAPYGALAERSLVRSAWCVPLPDGLDDVTAAALANPGMSAWAALALRAHLQPGETVLVNGATGSAGQLAVQLARYLGAGRVIATGRNPQTLHALSALGADVLLPFDLGAASGDSVGQYERALEAEFARGIDVVVDYLWGQSARAIITAVARAAEAGKPVRFVQVGEAGGSATLDLPGAALRSSAIELMGSGVKSVPFPKLLEATGEVFRAAGPAHLQIAARAVPLAEIAAFWDAPGVPRIVVTLHP